MKRIAILLAAGFLSALSGCASVQSGGSSGGVYAEDAELFEPETFESYGSFVVSAGTDNKPVNMRLWYSRPDQIEADTPVVMVMHGGRRDANKYRDYWGTYAKRYNALIIAPEISEEDFPTGWGYQTGNWVTTDSASYDESKGQRNPPEESSFAALERAFDAVKEQFGLDAETYDIWGHGSGAQFVHRMVMMWPQARIDTGVAANSGTYTFPDWTLPLRYGLKNTGVEPEDLKPAYKHHLVIMLGSEDNDPSHRLLSQLDIAIAQGEHRVEKGQNFYKVNKAQAEKLNTEYNWEIQTVYGIGHSGRKMSRAGAEFLLEGKTEKPLFSDDGAWNRDDEPEDTSEESTRRRELLRGSDDGEESPF
jgi:poly(3-hydroxybutyrate) depolymerase